MLGKPLIKCGNFFDVATINVQQLHRKLIGFCILA